MGGFDRTELFRALVRAAKKRTANKNSQPEPTPSTTLLREHRHRKTSQFTEQARGIAVSIGKLEAFVNQYRREYFDQSRGATMAEGRMTDSERDQVDREAQNLALVCSSALEQLASETSPALQAEPYTAQQHSHQQGVLVLLKQYLARVTAAMQELQASRAQLAQCRQKLSGTVPISSTKGKPTAGHADYLYGAEPSEHLEETLTDEERQALEQENSKLLDEFNELTDSVTEAEKKVLEIANLHRLFVDNVVKQAEEVDVLYSTTVETTSNVVKGNEQLQEVINDGWDFRIWALLFLVMCSASLLFLDWYG